MRLFGLIFALTFTAYSQDPAGLQWRKIRTPHFNILFPREIESEAQRAANTLETFYTPMSDAFSVKPKAATVILSNQTVNQGIGGYVSFIPFHARFFTTPAQGSFGTNDWLTMLAAHEGRHLIQLRATRRGLPRLARWLFGDMGTGMATMWSLPTWFLEGDARVAETQFTPGGQARLPYYQMITRTQVLTGKRYSYMKAVHGSYNEVVPDPYELGSFMVRRVNAVAGSEGWDRILKTWTRKAWNPIGLSRAIKKETGRTAPETYDEAMSELREKWSAKAEQVPYTEPPIVNRAPKPVWTAYYFAAYDRDGTILANKAGIANYPLALVRLHRDGREETLFHYRPGFDTRISAVNGQMVWDEYEPDPRWNRGYSVLVVRDLASGRTRRLTHKTRLEAPTLSPDGARIAAVESALEGGHALVIVDAGNGSLIQRFPSPEGDQLYTPAWSPDGRRIAVVRQPKTGGKALSLIDSQTGELTDLIPLSHGDLAEPSFFREYVLYCSPHNGIDNIYAVHTVTLKRFQVTSSHFGARAPHASSANAKLLYNDYSGNGFNIAEIPLDPPSWRPLETVSYAGLGYPREKHDYAAEIPATAYPVSRYHPWGHMFKAHTWGITSPPPDLGFGLMSTDPMRLLNVSAALKYNTNERTTGFETSATFRGLYPVLDLGFSRMDRKTEYSDHTDRWNERTTRFGFYIPFTLSRGYYYTWFGFGSGIESRRLGGGGLMPLNYWMAFHHYRHSSARDVAPRWGQSLSIGYRHTPASGEYYGNLLTADATVFVPSPVPHHSLQLEVGQERRQRGNYYFSSQLYFPRGYDGFASRELWKGSAAYMLPVAHPDFALGQVAYLKRITASLFYDYGRTDWHLFRSAGAEAVFQVHFFTITEPIRIGVRYAYRFDWYDNGRVEPFIQMRW